MKNFVKIALGILAAIGGYLEVGTLATTSQSGASFRFQLLWVVALGTLCAIVLTEMSGRLAAVSKHSLADAVRERFGWKFVVIPRLCDSIVNLLTVSAEIGGVSLGLYLATGIPLQVWAPIVGIVLWLVIAAGTLEKIEDIASILGLITAAFVVAALKMHPPMAEVAKGFIPSLPKDQLAHSAFVAISIIGSIISPYVFYFYSAGAVEEGWDEKGLGANRATAAIGMSFGSVMTFGVIVAAGMVFFPRGIQIDRYEQVALILTPALGKWGFPIFCTALVICCFGAAAEISLGNAYMLAQTFGWNWGENKAPAREARFSMTYTIFIAVGSLLMMTGIDPLKLTIFTMAITALVLPAVVLPFLLLMNDERYVGEHCNGPLSNALIVFVIFLSSIIALLTIPLQLMGAGG